MKKSLVSLIFIFLSMAFICCGGGGDDIGGGGDKTGSTVLNVNPANINFSSDGSQQSVTITANCAWKISGDDQWLTVSTHSGSNTATITLTAERNSSSQDRSCVLLVEGEGLKRSLTVTQKGSNVILEVSLSSISFEAGGAQQTLDITANCDWKISGEDQWLTVSTHSGSNSASVTLTAERNSSSQDRSCVLLVEGGGLSRSLTVTQKGSNVILEVSLSSISFEAGGAQQTLDITANCDWKISGGAQWLSVSPDNGNANATVTLTAGINATLESRSCTLSLVGGGQTRSIVVTQNAGDPTIVVPDEDDNGLPNY